MKSYDTVTEAVSDLKERGYTYDFNMKGDALFCPEKNIYVKPEEFEVNETYRFEGDSDPGDESVVYAISSTKYDLKGVLTEAFGTYAESASAEMLKKLQYKAENSAPE